MHLCDITGEFLHPLAIIENPASAEVEKKKEKKLEEGWWRSFEKEQTCTCHLVAFFLYTTNIYCNREKVVSFTGFFENHSWV